MWVRVRHLRLGLAHRLAQFVQAPGGQHAVERDDIQVPGTRVLRQVAHAAAAPYGPGRGLRLAGEHLGEGGLARAVASDEADSVPLGDLEGRFSQQQPCAGTQLYATGDDHDVSGYLIRAPAL